MLKPNYVERFNVYKKQKKMYWTNTLIVYTIFFICVAIGYFKKNILGFEKRDVFENILIFIAICSLVYGLIMKLTGLARYEPLKGKMGGFLTLDLTKIIIEDEVYNISDIKKIEFDCGDYYGRFKYTSRGSFEANLSRGVDNTISLTLNSGKIISSNFELYNKNDLEKARLELINYYLENKIHFLKLIDYLGITDYDQIQEFKKTLLPTADKRNR